MGVEWAFEMTGILLRRGEEMRGGRQPCGDEGRGQSDRHTYKDHQQTAKVRRGGRILPKLSEGAGRQQLEGLQTPAPESRVQTPSNKSPEPQPLPYFVMDSASFIVYTTISLHFLFVD